MLAIALIVFRETLEAALLVGVIAAATRGLPARARWLGGGVAAGVAGALMMALAAERIAAWADGLGQDLVNVVILGLALAMLAWHGIWGSQHGRESAVDASRMGASVRTGDRTPWALAIACALAVLREGAETVLFVMGMAAGNGADASTSWAGVGLGLASGVGVGALLYFGLSRIPVHRLFSVTQALVLLVTAAIASQLARAVTQAGWAPSLGTPLWDSSAWLAPDGALGMLLHALLGYDAHPSALQLLFYVGTLVGITLASRRTRTPRPRPALA